MEHDHRSAHIGENLLAPQDPQPDEWHRDKNAESPEHQVANRNLTHRHVSLCRVHHGEQPTAEVRAQHESKRHIKRDDARTGQRGGQQHDGQARIGKDRQRRAGDDFKEQVAAQRLQQHARYRCLGQGCG